jgi:capsular polysaccharide transport system permease protein
MMREMQSQSSKSNPETSLWSDQLAVVQQLVAEGDLQAATTRLAELLGLHFEQEQVLQYASWFYGVNGMQSDAKRIYEELSLRGLLAPPQWSQYAAILSQSGDLEGASRAAKLALEGDPAERFFLIQYARLLIERGRVDEAGEILVDGLEKHGRTADVLKLLSELLLQLGDRRDALSFAQKAYILDERDLGLALHYANLLLREERLVDCVNLLDRSLLLGVRHELIFILISTALARIGDFEKALQYINRGLEAEGRIASLLLQKGVYLAALAKYEESAVVLRELVERYPNQPGGKEAYLASLNMCGSVDVAASVAALLVADNPRDMARVIQLNNLLGRLKDFSGESTFKRSLDIALSRSASVQSIRGTQFSSILIIQLRVLHALFYREARTRFSHTRFGYAWVVFEPLAHIAIMVILINAFASGNPPLGTSFAVFYFTGIIPFHLFSHTSSYLLSGVSGNKHLLLLPRVTQVDVLLARGLVEFVTEACVAILIFCGFLLAGLSVFPIDPLGVVAAFFLVWFCGLGMGMINSSLALVFSGWEKIWGATVALLYFASGTFYIPRAMPQPVREILSWNPVLQGIEMLRFNFFHGVKPPWLSESYLLCIGIILFGSGLTLVRLTRKRVYYV